jgi:hypothetical protein
VPLGRAAQRRVQDERLETRALALGVDETQEGRGQIRLIFLPRKRGGGAQEERRQREARQPAMPLRS